VTFDQALANLIAARDAVPGAVADAIDQVGQLAEQRVREAWPRASGASADAWKWDGRALTNDEPYVSFVHDGLADRLVPQTFRDLEPTFRELVESRINAAGGFDG
jgi:hypothetical protein